MLYIAVGVGAKDDFLAASGSQRKLICREQAWREIACSALSDLYFGQLGSIGVVCDHMYVRGGRDNMF